VFDGVDDRPGLIRSGASRNGALFRLRRLGLERQRSEVTSQNEEDLLSAPFSVPSALCLPPVSPLAIPPRARQLTGLTPPGSRILDGTQSVGGGRKTPRPCPRLLIFNPSGVQMHPRSIAVCAQETPWHARVANRQS
jgi:hypothetical protein